jgi:hypothetical protein
MSRQAMPMKTKPMQTTLLKAKPRKSNIQAGLHPGLLKL